MRPMWEGGGDNFTQYYYVYCVKCSLELVVGIVLVQGTTMS